MEAHYRNLPAGGNIKTASRTSSDSSYINSNLFAFGYNCFYCISRLKTKVKLRSGAVAIWKAKFIGATRLPRAMTVSRN